MLGRGRDVREGKGGWGGEWMLGRERDAGKGRESVP